VTDQTWLEVSLVVNGEMAEAVAEVLARFLPNGVVIESTTIDTSSGDTAGEVVGPLRVFGYLQWDDQLEDTRQRLEESLWYLGRIHPLPKPKFQKIQQADWSQVWKQNYRPIAIGDNLMIVPAWLEKPQENRIPIHIDPGMAFGTGTHPTTQLCLELIEEILDQYKPTEIIDIGCGSGILSIAALKLGARYALGVDLDADALSAAAENAKINDLTGQLELGLGSLAEIKNAAFSIQQAPLVVANILSPVIIRLIGDGLGGLLTPKGNLVLSGILEEQVGEVEAAVHKSGLLVAEKRGQDDWVAIRVVKH